MTIDQFNDQMIKASKDFWNGLLIKRRLFTSQFRYAPLSCRLCEEGETRRNPTFFQIGLLDNNARFICIRHMRSYHFVTYTRTPDLANYFTPAKVVPQMEKIFEGKQFNVFGINYFTSIFRPHKSRMGFRESWLPRGFDLLSYILQTTCWYIEGTQHAKT